ncbi:MAG: efflux RND transporter periplasmic adaptor subunit [Spirochaetes bacterium]|nr:efflux RND transporter periplasmic adaptor subunit [Spirochaetota bacterium]
MKHHLLYAASYPLILMIFLSGCTGREKAPEGKTTADNNQENVVEVKTVKVKLQKVIPQISSFGNISFKSKTDISSAVNGIVRHISVDIGDRVTPGMILASIRNIQLKIEEQRAQAEIRSAEAALSLAGAQLAKGKLQVKARLLNLEKKKLQINQKKAELKELEKIIQNKEELLKVDGITREKLRELKLRHQSGLAGYNMLLKDYQIESIGLTDEDITDAFGRLPEDGNLLSGSGSISGRTRENLIILLNTRTLQAQVKVAEARLETAETKLSSVKILLDELVIKSDFNGIVGARYVEEGERIKEGTRLFTTFNSSTVYAVFPLQENRAGLLSKGERVKIIIPSLGDKIFNGKIDIISPTIDSESGNINVKALITNTSEKMLPGMFVKVSVVTGKPLLRLMIPIVSIVKKQAGRAQIFTVVNKRAFLKEITVGAEEGEQIEVEDGLKEGETVITKPPPILREGMPVKYGKPAKKL